VLILSAAQTLDSAASLRQMSEYLVTQKVPLAFGGGIFNRVPAAIQSISGYYLGTDMAMVSQNIESFVTVPPSMPKATPVSHEYTQTLGRFLQNETPIISYVASEIQSKPIEPAHVETANANLTRMISSALILGDINLLDHSISWLNGLLENRGLLPSVAMQFYTTYQKAVECYLGDEGAIIRDWLSKQQLHE
jgi:hypothetical protein